MSTFRSHYLLILILLFSSCSSFKKETISYPDHWWQPIAKGQQKWWEISPDFVAKDSGKVVLSKRNELGLLSNFAYTPFEFEGKKYKTVEGLWQSMKFPEGPEDKRYGNIKLKYTRDQVAQMKGFAAKKAGDYAKTYMKKDNINWVTYNNNRLTYRTSKRGNHYKLIRRIMLAKLNQNPKVKEVLLKTKGLELVADHTTSPLDPPAWKYYKIWMEIRDSL